MLITGISFQIKTKPSFQKKKEHKTIRYMKKKLFSLLVLLMVAVSGAWALTTHVVTQATVDQIFKGDGYTLGDAVAAGDVLDFQGEIDLQHSLVINKQVNIKSTTKDAVVKLHTVAGSLTGNDPGNSFVINKAGSGTTVQDIRIENTETWIFNTSNVTFTGVTMWVEEARVGSGVGHVALRYSDHITLDGCTVYTKNNGGSSAFVLTGSHDCTFKDTRFEAAGNVGNVLYIGNPFNTGDMPAGYTMNNDNISVINCTINTPSNPLQLAGYRHRVEGCTIVKGRPTTAYGGTLPDSPENGYIFRNNIFSNTNGTMTVFPYSTVEGNTITVTGNGKLTVNKGSTVTGNTINGNVEVSANNSDYIGSTITGNSILGKVTFSNNSKNNTFTGNTVISSEEYAVYLNSTADDANNAVKNNVLLGAFREGDDAVYCKKPEVNTVIDNTAKAYDYELTVAKSEHGSGTIKFFIGDYELKGAYEKYEGKTITMTVTPEEGYVVGSVSANAYTTWASARRKAPAAIPMLGNVTLTPVEGKANTWTFTMPAASVLVSAAYIPVAAFAPAEPSGTLAPTAAEGVIAGEDKAIIVAGTVANIPETTNPQGTVKYFVTDNKDMTAEQAAKANGWVETLPTAAGYTGSYADDFQVYVWYYIQAATGYADSKPQRIEVTVQSNLFDLTLNPANANTIEAGKATVTVDGTDKTVTEGKLQGVKMGIEVKVKANTGYKFRKVEVKKKAAAKPLANATTEDLGKVVGADGKIYATKADAEAVATGNAVAMICYVNEGHGLAGTKDWSTAMNTCAAHTPAITGGTWKLASKDEWFIMISAAGSYSALRDGFSSVGGTNMKSNAYWSSTEYEEDCAWGCYFNNGIWDDNDKDANLSVRACLAF